MKGTRKDEQNKLYLDIKYYEKNINNIIDGYNNKKT